MARTLLKSAVMRSLTHANGVRSFFRQVFFGAALMPAVIVPIAACSGGTGSAPETEEGGTTSDPSASSPTTGPCRAKAAGTMVDAQRACFDKWDVELEGDLSTCTDASYLTSETCTTLCGHKDAYCPKPNEGNKLSCQIACAVDGRRYDALDDADAPIAHDVASYLARMAFFEAASVDAFVILDRELRTHGAPDALLRSCAAARADEVRHAKMARTIAKRHGARVIPSPKSSIPEVRTLEAMATENAVEACIYESFGVVVGMWQAAHAPTKELRAFFAKLVEDESRHAALAWRVDVWARAQLDANANARIDRARDAALDVLARELAAEPIGGLGLPSAHEARALFATFARQIRSEDLRTAA